MRLIEFFLSGVCHQIPERCFVYQGQPLPLCARCMGTFLGALAAMLTLALIGHGRRSQLPPRRLLLALALLVGFWALDGVNSAARLVLARPLLYEPSNTLRLLTGLGMGMGMGVLLYPIYHLVLWRHIEDRRALEEGWAVAPLLLVAALLAAVILLWQSAPFLLWAVVAAAAAGGVLALANGLLIALLLRHEGRAESWRGVVPYLALGLAAALVETGSLALIRQMVLGPTI